MAVPTLILASASPRRRDLIARLGLEPAGVRAADIDETPLKAELPRVYAARMAREKALAAALDAAEEKVDRLREKLEGLDIDSLSPREALDLLYELKRDAAT